jgi:hypothetical protein
MERQEGRQINFLPLYWFCIDFFTFPKVASVGMYIVSLLHGIWNIPLSCESGSLEDSIFRDSIEDRTTKTFSVGGLELSIKGR